MTTSKSKPLPLSSHGETHTSDGPVRRQAQVPDASSYDSEGSVSLGAWPASDSQTDAHHEGEPASLLAVIEQTTNAANTCLAGTSIVRAQSRPGRWGLQTPAGDWPGVQHAQANRFGLNRTCPTDRSQHLPPPSRHWTADSPWAQPLAMGEWGALRSSGLSDCSRGGDWLGDYSETKPQGQPGEDCLGPVQSPCLCLVPCGGSIGV